MKKYDSLMYLKKLGLPICQVKLFEWYDYEKAIEYANYLRIFCDGVGLRIDSQQSFIAETGCPFFLKISNKEIKKVFQKYREQYFYLISEHIDSSKAILHGTAYLLPNRILSIQSNAIDKESCRKAIESPAQLNNIKNYQCNWDCSNVIYKMMRQYLLRASLKDVDIIGKRLEWSYYKHNGLIFWQISDDPCFLDIKFKTKRN